MILRNLEIVGQNKVGDISVCNSKLDAVGGAIINNIAGEYELTFDDAIIFPGLINSHDHLDFNLFPQLGNRVYDNYVAWGDDIHAHNKGVINDVLKIPLSLRVQWGMYKNLLNGVTTVVNHGHHLDIEDEFITVFQRFQYLHSIQLEQKWRYKLNKPGVKQPFVTHIGEGTDKGAKDEIDKLIRWNLLNKDLVGVHGIAVTEAQAPAFKALVWCPVSNYFLIGRTADIDLLKKHTTILFGTDATVSAHWNIWEHLRMARQEDVVSDNELYNMLSQAASQIWGLDSTGVIATGYDADLVVAKRYKGLHGFDAYYALDPADILLVLHKGVIRLFDDSLHNQLGRFGIEKENFSKVIIGGCLKHVYGNLPALMREIKSYYKDITFPFESSEHQ